MSSLAQAFWQISYGATDDRLNDFYIPALEASIRFDRTTGFFSSAALAIAAAGIVRLIENGGKMRLLCGAQLSVEDVEALDRGAALKGVVGATMVGGPLKPGGPIHGARLEALAWVVAQGEDAASNRLAFTGSGNDSVKGWRDSCAVFNGYTT